MKHYSIHGIITLVACIGLIIGWSCSMNKKRSDKLIKSRLYQDLYLDHRDAMYRAMTFIAQNGGPASSADTKEGLVAHREQARDWLLVQEEPGGLLTAYERFLQSWNPVFLE